jgi:hypothetical protein
MNVNLEDMRSGGRLLLAGEKWRELIQYLKEVYGISDGVLTFNTFDSPLD